MHLQHSRQRCIQTMIWIMLTALSIPQFSIGFDFCESELRNKSVSQMKQNEHYYYRSCILVDEELADMLWNNNFQRNVTVVNGKTDHKPIEMATNLTFDFPFYGDILRTVTLSHEGFISLGNDEIYVGSSAVRYIAPLMLQSFRLSRSSNSTMQYILTDDSFTLQWLNIGAEPLIDIGHFTFQATLHRNGSIAFVYKTIPSIHKWMSHFLEKRVQIGTSNAYRQPVPNSGPLTTQFHKTDFLDLDQYLLQNFTVILLDPLPTCEIYTDCGSCFVAKIKPDGCFWCPKIKKCTSAIQVYSSIEIIRGCGDVIVGGIEKCTVTQTTDVKTKRAADVYGTSFRAWIWIIFGIFIAIDAALTIIFWERIKAALTSRLTSRSTYVSPERENFLQDTGRNLDDILGKRTAEEFPGQGNAGIFSL